MGDQTKRAAGDVALAQVPGAALPDRRNVCNCFQVTYEDMERILQETDGASFEALKLHYQVGTRCTSCEYEIKDMIRVYAEERARGSLGVPGVRIPLGRRLGTWYREFKTSIRHHLTLRRFAIFVIRRQGLASSLVLSNLDFPEDARNANGERIRFNATLFDAAGVQVGRATGLALEAGRSREYTLDELFPGLQGEIAGMLVIDFRVLRQVGSLRPYCVLNYTHGDPPRPGRWHYHDKYSTADYNGHYHCNHPLPAGQECWLALSNPVDRPYRSDVHLRLSDGRVVTRHIDLPALASAWIEVRALFGIVEPATQGDGNALLWFDSNQRLMVWCFWRKVAEGLWLVQHH